MTPVVLLYLDCSHVVWFDDGLELDRMAKDSPPYYVPCKVCSSDEPVIYWERREVGNEVDLYDWFRKRSE